MACREAGEKRRIRRGESDYIFVIELEKRSEDQVNQTALKEGGDIFS